MKPRPCAKPVRKATTKAKAPDTQSQPLPAGSWWLGLDPATFYAEAHKRHPDAEPKALIIQRGWDA